MQLLDAEDSVPLAFMGYSFGTYVCYECIQGLTQRGLGDKCCTLISVAGIAREFLEQFPLYSEEFNIYDEAEFRRRGDETAIQMYRKVPFFLEEGFNPKLRLHAGEGEEQC